jgi:hypothetical protein
MTASLLRLLLLLALLAQCVALVVPLAKLGRATFPCASGGQWRAVDPTCMAEDTANEMEPEEGWNVDNLMGMMAEAEGEAPAAAEPKKQMKQDLFGSTTTVGTKTIPASPAVLTVAVTGGFLLFRELVTFVREVSAGAS